MGSELAELSGNPADLGRGGRWAVVVDYEGRFTGARFDRWEPGPPDAVAGPWAGPTPAAWRSSMSPAEYRAAVQGVRRRIARGDVYQANVCRILSADATAGRDDLGGLHALLCRDNPAPYEGFLRLPDLQLATASPELFLRRSGRHVRTGPIKGTAATAAGLLPKDEAENVMIVDLMRNDLATVCEPGSVRVPRLLDPEPHPGLVHLVSEVTGTLRPECGWPDVLRHLMPPGSVSGAPKRSAVDILRELEPEPRGPYCGAIGWVDGDAGTAVLAVGIRTFWRRADGPMRFGTGAGVTWGSDPDQEWRETELKAQHLLQVASGEWSPT